MSETNVDLQRLSDHIEPMSRIEKIGRGLYGDSWQAQIARDLKNEDGESLSRHTVQSWHKRDNLPAWAVEQLLEIAKDRIIIVSETVDFLKLQKTQTY